MQLSHSRVSTFVQCPYKFKLKYIEGFETFPPDDPASPLVIGHALHTGIEKGVEAAIDEYYNAFPIITDKHIDEAIKLEYWIPKVKDILPVDGLHEVKIEDEDFLGFIDYLVPAYGEGHLEGDNYVNDLDYFDLYDFKYSNNVKNYMDSEQLHLYKYYFEKLNPTKKIRKMYFMFIPKSSLRIKYKNKTNKRDEKLDEFRKRTIADLDNKKIEIVDIDYDPNKVIDFITNGKHAVECDDYIKQPSRLCDWCEYQKFCEKGDDLEMVLPSTNRRTIEKNSYKKIWIYGLPFSGKNYLANQFETPLMLNTDGNFKQVDAPVVRIIDEVTQEGRITKRKYAWEVFQDTVAELEKGSDFKTIIVDLLEDVYDACRIKVCVDNGWDHESDDSFKAYDIVRSEFLRTLKRLINLDYNIVLISHEDTSRDITKKTGDKITAIKPNLQEKLALKVAGMVDLCFRIVNDNGNRTISFKSNEVEFGGGRLNIKAKEIPAKYEELMKVYNENNKGKEIEKTSGIEETPEKSSGVVETATTEPEKVETPEAAPVRTRKKREVVDDAKVEENAPKTEEEAVPVKRTRRKREAVEETRKQ